MEVRMIMDASFRLIQTEASIPTCMILLALTAQTHMDPWHILQVGSMV
jgi:hypothetical protein